MATSAMASVASHLAKPSNRRFTSPLFRSGMDSAIGEYEPGTRHEVFDRPGHEDFSRSRLRRDALTDVHRDPADVVFADLDLAGVQTGAYFDAERPDSRADRLCAAHGSGGPIEGGEHAVARRVHFAPSVAIELL